MGKKKQKEAQEPEVQESEVQESEVQESEVQEPEAPESPPIPLADPGLKKTGFMAPLPGVKMIPGKTLRDFRKKG